MSTTDAQAQATAVPESRGSSLALLQGPVLPAGVPAEFRMTEEEFEELEDYGIKPLILAFDGRNGSFKNVETQEILADLRGAVLGAINGQVWFGPEDAAERRWQWPTWICRANNVKGRPVLNPTLTSEQHAEATRRGAGSSCATCPLRQWRGDEKPTCSAKVSLLWFDEQLVQPCLVQAGGTSIKAIRNFVGGHKRQQLSLFSYVQRLTSEAQKDGSKEWHELRFEKGDMMTVEGFRFFRELRQTLMASIDSHLDRAAAAADAQEVDSPGPAPEVPQDPSTPGPARPAPAPRPAATAPRGRGIQLSEDGEVVGQDFEDPFAEDAHAPVGYVPQASARPSPVDEGPPPPIDDDFTPLGDLDF